MEIIRDFFGNGKKLRPQRYLAQLSIWRGRPGILDIDIQLNSLVIKDSKVIKSHQMLPGKITCCID